MSFTGLCSDQTGKIKSGRITDHSVTDEDIELFKTVLQSFRPVTE